jgi:hypothetical protein
MPVQNIWKPIEDDEVQETEREMHLSEAQIEAINQAQQQHTTGQYIFAFYFMFLYGLLHHGMYSWKTYDWLLRFLFGS